METNSTLPTSEARMHFIISFSRWIVVTLSFGLMTVQWGMCVLFRFSSVSATIQILSHLERDRNLQLHAKLSYLTV